jgi:hypothetical protein
MRRTLLLATLALVSIACSAQDSLDGFSGSVTGQGAVSGHVYIESCGPSLAPGRCPQQGVSSMMVTFSGDRKTVVTVRSDSRGAYTARLPAGAYTASIGDIGQPLDQATITVRAGETARLDFRIRSAAVG